MQSNTTKLGGIARIVGGGAVTYSGVYLIWLSELGDGILGPGLRMALGITLLLTGPFMIFEGLNCW